MLLTKNFVNFYRFIMNVGIIQARTGSSRLPGKILMNVAGKTLLEHMVQRISNSKKLDKIVI